MVYIITFETTISNCPSEIHRSNDFAPFVPTCFMILNLSIWPIGELILLLTSTLWNLFFSYIKLAFHKEGNYLFWCIMLFCFAFFPQHADILFVYIKLRKMFTKYRKCHAQIRNGQMNAFCTYTCTHACEHKLPTHTQTHTQFIKNKTYTIPLMQSANLDMKSYTVKYSYISFVTVFFIVEKANRHLTKLLGKIYLMERYF